MPTPCDVTVHGQGDRRPVRGSVRPLSTSPIAPNSPGAVPCARSAAPIAGPHPPGIGPAARSAPEPEHITPDHTKPEHINNSTRRIAPLWPTPAPRTTCPPAPPGEMMPR